MRHPSTYTSLIRTKEETPQQEVIQAEQTKKNYKNLRYFMMISPSSFSSNP